MFVGFVCGTVFWCYEFFVDVPIPVKDSAGVRNGHIIERGRRFSVADEETLAPAYEMWEEGPLPGPSVEETSGEDSISSGSTSIPHVEPLSFQNEDMPAESRSLRSMSRFQGIQSRIDEPRTSHRDVATSMKPPLPPPPYGVHPLSWFVMYSFLLLHGYICTYWQLDLLPWINSLFSFTSMRFLFLCLLLSHHCRRLAVTTLSDLNSLPPGFEQLVDVKTGKVYFRNNKTQETSWEDPRRRRLIFDGDESDFGSEGDPYPYDPSDRKPEQDLLEIDPRSQPLPPGWVSKFDLSTNKWYFEVRFPPHVCLSVMISFLFRFRYIYIFIVPVFGFQDLNLCVDNFASLGFVCIFRTTTHDIRRGVTLVYFQKNGNFFGLLSLINLFSLIQITPLTRGEILDLFREVGPWSIVMSTVNTILFVSLIEQQLGLILALSNQHLSCSGSSIFFFLNVFPRPTVKMRIFFLIEFHFLFSLRFR